MIHLRNATNSMRKMWYDTFARLMGFTLRENCAIIYLQHNAIVEKIRIKIGRAETYRQISAE